MWGYQYTTTGGETVYVYYGNDETGDVYTYTLENYIDLYDATTFKF